MATEYDVSRGWVYALKSGRKRSKPHREKQNSDEF
jgi:hypothetical protein